MPVQHDDIKELDEEMVTEIAAGFATLTRNYMPDCMVRHLSCA
jgi:hypothetical protein